MNQVGEHHGKKGGKGRWGFFLLLHPLPPLTEMEHQCSTEHSFTVPGDEGKGFCNAVPRAPSQQVGFLASHPSSQDYFAWVLFHFVLFYPKTVYCKIHKQSWESSPHTAESSDHRMVVQKAGHSHPCLSALGKKKP